jgi:hypothetical protein
MVRTLVAVCALVGALCFSEGALGQVPEGTPSPPSTSCDAIEANNFGKACQSEKDGATVYPYCRLVTGLTATTPKFECRECKTLCDCPLDMYCSSEPGEIGQCRRFAMQGKKCRPLSTAQLASSDINDDWKCADVFSDNNVLNVNHRGSCVDEVCEFCQPSLFGGGGTCDPTDGTNVERTCVYPGVLVDSHAAQWAAGSYSNQIMVVWSTIFFVFFILFLICQCIRTVMMFK